MIKIILSVAVSAAMISQASAMDPKIFAPLPPPAVACGTPAALHNPHCKPPTVTKTTSTSTSPSASGRAAPGWIKAAHQGVFICAGGIVGTALLANFINNRELTQDEAFSCGVKYALGGWRRNGNPPNLLPVTTCHGAHYKQPGARYCGA